MKNYDAVVVGGGMAGAATTYNLSQWGLKVLLLERDNITSGASGRNGGQVIQLDGRDKDAEAIMNRLKYSTRTVDLLKVYEKELDFDFEFRQIGSIDVAADEAEYQELKELCGLQVQAGDREIEFLDWKGLHEICPFLGENFLGARYRWTDGNLSPFALTHGFVEKSIKYGAEVRTHCRVDSVVIESGQVKGVVAGDEKIAADKVVLATSASTQELVPELQVIPLRSHAALSEAIPEIKGPAFEVVYEGEIIYGSTQFKNGHILLGGGPDRPRTREEQYDYVMSWKDTQKNASILGKLFPRLGDINIFRCWAGTMGTTPDGLPLVGKSRLADGLFVIAGFPNGMAYISYIAKMLAHLVADKVPETNIDLFDPDRFNDLTVEIPERYNYTILADYLGRL
jgi:sarcosine oxidase subunit beta